MASENDLGDRKVVNLDRGLYLVEYKGAEDPAPPKIVVEAAPGHDSDIEIITHPDGDGATLWQPQTSLVVRVLGPAPLHVTVVPTVPKGSRVAQVSVQPLRQGDSADARGARADDIRMIGHVAGVGDVSVGMNEWIAGPAAPSRIEGLMVQWPQKPQRLDLRYSVKVGAGQGANGPLVGTGEFAGTRGRALPLTGVVFEISGAQSDDHIVTADAIFLNSPMMRVSGKRIVLSGPTGREPLVGLRLAIETSEQLTAKPRATPERSQATAAAAEPAATKSQSGGRVRVFRSRSQPAQG